MDQEPIQTRPNQNGTGRPEVSDEQYRLWLEDMRPFLQGGSSLHRAMEKTNLTNHKNRIYQKSKLNDWFREKIDIYQATIGELTNETFFLLITQINDRVKRGQPIDRKDVQILKTMAKKHRACQPFFVSRVERTEINKENVGQIIERPTIKVVVPKEDETPDD